MTGLRKCLLLAILLTPPVASAAQQSDRRVRINVDYQAGQTLYISAGAAQGLFANDTVVAFAPAGTAPLGRLVIMSSTRSRAVAAYAGASFAVSRGDVLLLEISEAAQAQLRSAQAIDSSTATPPAARRDATTPSVRYPAHPSLAVHGQAGLDFDAAQSTAEWGSEPGQQDVRRFSNQSGRLRFTASGLPGGARLVTNLRVSSYGGFGATPGDFAVRIYQASLEKDFTTIPFRLQLGRFYNPYESHSGYWDGALLRLGGEVIGAGVVAGYEPDNGNEQFSATRPKLTGFLDLHGRAGDVRYDGDLSWHRDQPHFAATEREFVGITQRVTWRGAFFTQRTQLGHLAGGTWSLWQTQVTGSLALLPALRLHARYATERNDLFDPGVIATRRERRSLGLSLSNALGYASLEAGTTASGFGTEGRMLYTTVAWPRAPLGISLGFSGSYWTEADVKSSSWSPALERAFGPIRARGAYQFYRTDYTSGSFQQQGGEISLTTPLPAAAELYVTLRSDWSGGTTSQRVLTSIWKSF